VPIAIQVISSHPLLNQAVGRIFARARNFSVPVLPSASSEKEALHGSVNVRLFILDSCTLRIDLGPFAARCRAHSPGSKFLALIPPGHADFTEQTRLFYWGIDGFVELLQKSWEAELPHAIDSILKGQFWVPPEVMVNFIKQSKAMLQAQLFPGQSLTRRELQVLQLLMRRSTNKEISAVLEISERTVKFHVSNILSKLQLEDRRGLSLDVLALRALASVV